MSLLGLASSSEPGVDVLNADSAAAYWDRSDMFDLALDLTAGRRGLAALGEVAARWIRHLLQVEVEIEALTELHDIALTWYVGLDSNATRMGDALWHGESQPQDEFLIGLYRLTFVHDAEVIERMRGEPTYLLIAGASDMTLRLKPQNLITGLPLRQAAEIVQLISTALQRIPVGVIVERRKARSPWADHICRAVNVLAGVPAATAWTVVDASPEGDHLLCGRSGHRVAPNRDRQLPGQFVLRLTRVVGSVASGTDRSRL